jgi:hypothetical protein
LTIKATGIGYSPPALHRQARQALVDKEKHMDNYSFVGMDWFSLIGVSVAIYLLVELFARVQAREKARKEQRPD